MRPRRPNPRLVKIHRNYSVEEVAKLFGIHKNTVRAWIKAGLPICDGRHPCLLLGCDLAAFIKAKRAKNKQSCLSGQMYCLRCRIPQYPAGNMADFQPYNEKIGNLIGICPECNLMMNRRVSMAKIGQVKGQLDITFPLAQKHIGDGSQPSLNNDF